MAFSTVGMLVPLVVFLLSQRFVVSGVTSGGLKG
jgi:ABC-type glycerol-3-phosphate transport system permease component